MKTSEREGQKNRCFQQERTTEQPTSEQHQKSLKRKSRDHHEEAMRISEQSQDVIPCCEVVPITQPRRIDKYPEVHHSEVHTTAP